ncbi:MAG: putative lipopolysaccharide heptosyltransferase III [Nitrospirae bacterium]|nr:putative lipopolysaccharide heptosyltransferase III [Nitrospirota bacterium]
MFKNVKKILVIKLRHIGDVLLTAPVMRALKEAFPDSKISVLANKGTEDVLTGNPLISEVITFERKIKDMTSMKRIGKEMAFLKMLRAKGFDMTVDLTGGDRAAVASYCSGARYRIGMQTGKGFAGKRFLYTNTSKPDSRKHTVLQNMDIVKKFGIDTAGLSVDFHVPQNEREPIKKILEKCNIDRNDIIVHIHPTSRWLFKCWKDEYMAEIIGWLIQKGIKVILTSSPDRREMEKAENIISLASAKDTGSLINLCGRTSIKGIGAVSEVSSLFFGVDSAPMHIAAAVNTPVVALFGPSGAFHWGPWDNNYRAEQEEPYLKRNGIQTFGMHTVIQKTDDCIPCGKDGCKGSKKSRCLDEITPEEVKAVLYKKLEAIRK